MVCVLQSKLPRSSAVFQLYCQLFFFVFFSFLLNTPHISHLLLLSLSFAAARFASVFDLFHQSIFWGAVYGGYAFDFLDAGFVFACVCICTRS